MDRGVVRLGSGFRVVKKSKRDDVVESEGEVRALQHVLNLVKLNLKSAKERLKQAKEEGRLN
jgi:hypothetical protein